MCIRDSVWAHAGNAPIASHKSSKKSGASRSEAAVGTYPARVKVFHRLPYRKRICERSERFMKFSLRLVLRRFDYRSKDWRIYTIDIEMSKLFGAVRRVFGGRGAQHNGGLQEQARRAAKDCVTAGRS